MIYTSIRENNLNGQIKVYPNPIHSALFVEIGNSNTDYYSVGVYSLTGEKIFHLEGSKPGTTEIPFSRFENGIYLLKITSSDGRNLVKKIIKE